jgi:ACT domain-containing protein
VADGILPFEALFDEATMSTADAAKKFGFSRASGFEDFRDRLMEQLAVDSEKILGVSIAESNLGIEISCWRRGVIGIMEFRASVFPHGVTEISKLAEG